MDKFSWLIFRNKRTSHEEEVALIKASNLFDTAWYLDQNPELKSSKIDPVSHYLKTGALAGQDPSPNFSSIGYIRDNPDVGAAKINPLLHYVKHGLPEGRPSVVRDARDRHQNVDIFTSYLPNRELLALVKALRKTLRSRLEQLRSLRAVNALTEAKQVELTGLFDRQYYRETYPEVPASGEDEAEHFARIGWKNGYKPNADFDTEFYIENYADIARLGINPLIHYADYGIIEGREAGRRHPSKIIAEHTTYESWVAQYDTITDNDRRSMRARILRFRDRSCFSIIMPVYNTNINFLRQAIDSVIAQVYPYWELCIADDASTNPEVKVLLKKYQNQDSRIKIAFREKNGHISQSSNSSLSLATGDFIALMDHDDVIPENALFEFASRIDEQPDLDILYSDEDHIDAENRRFGPYFKSAYSHELMLSQNLLNHFSVYRRSIINKIGGFRVGFEGSQDYDLALRAIDASDRKRIAHIPSILYHWRSGAGEATFSEAFMDRCLIAARLSITEHLKRRREPGDVVANPVVPTWHRVIRSFDGEEPLISVIVPTKDKADILRTCCEGVLNATDYRNLELIVVDHQSVERETLDLFKELERDPRVKILRYTGPFNYSTINNFAVDHARGTLICLLNNDVEVIEPNWLRELATHAILDDVGAVGAKLLYPDDRTQHGGVILGVGGVAGHRFHLLDRNDPGPMHLATLTSDISAVTAACLVVKRSLFLKVGGLDAENLPVAFNDIDLCIKIHAAGFRNIYNPYSMLYHHESLSRGDDLTGEKQKRFMREVSFMIEKWGDFLVNDPFYNPNLNLSSADYSLSWPPRKSKPWYIQ